MVLTATCALFLSVIRLWLTRMLRAPASRAWGSGSTGKFLTTFYMPDGDSPASLSACAGFPVNFYCACSLFTWYYFSSYTNFPVSFVVALLGQRLVVNIPGGTDPSQGKQHTTYCLHASLVTTYTKAPRFGATPWDVAPRGTHVLFMRDPCGTHVLFRWYTRTI